MKIRLDVLDEDLFFWFFVLVFTSDFVEIRRIL